MLARLFENSMREVNASLIEAARSFGASNGQILRHVVVKEAFPSLVMDLVVGTVSIVGFSAAAGAVGAGG